jgi:FkbM family methyltransferase
MNTERLYQSARSRLGLGPSLVTREVAGRRLKLRYGTVPPEPEKDDGWAYFLISECSSLLDVGCNVGFDAVLACALGAKALAVDANPAALAVAAENLFLNGFANQVGFFLGFAGDSDGEELAFYTIGTGAAGSAYASAAKTASDRGSQFKVTTATLDTICYAHDFRPDLIKIDVEGAEVEALKGAARVVKENKPRMLVEVHSPRERPMRENAALILGWCRENSYDAFYLAEHLKVDSPEPFAHRGRCHLLLLPEGQSYPEGLRDIPEHCSLEEARQLTAMPHLAER